MYRIAVCDDEPKYLELVEKRLKKYCEQRNLIIAIKLYRECDTVIEEAENGKLYDVYILDIEMAGSSGMEAARAIGESSSMACIIFLTAHEAYAVEACGLNIFRYILKDRMDHELENVLDELFSKLDKMKDDGVYTISNQRKYVKMLRRDIVYIYKSQKNIVFVLRDGTEEGERTTLKEVYEKLKSRDMFFLDRGIILNLFHVQKITGDTIRLTGEHHISTTMEHIMELKRALGKYWGEIL